MHASRVDQFFFIESISRTASNADLRSFLFSVFSCFNSAAAHIVTMHSFGVFICLLLLPLSILTSPVIDRQYTPKRDASSPTFSNSSIPGSSSTVQGASNDYCPAMPSQAERIAFDIIVFEVSNILSAMTFRVRVQRTVH